MAPLLVKVVRHGQTFDNSNHIMQGWKNDAGSSLNETGLAQAVMLAQAYGAEVEGWRRVYTSDLLRASVTASTLRSLVPNPPPLTVDERLRERNMGSFQGMSLDHFLANGSHFPPDAETMQTMRARGQEFWQSVVVPLAKEGEGGTIAIVSHGAFLLNTFLHLLETGALTAVASVVPGKLPNTSVTTVLVDDVTGAGEIQAWGDVGHLFLPSDGTSTPGGHLKPPTMVGDMSGGE